MSEPRCFGARATLEVGGESYEIFRLDALQREHDVARLPYSLKILLENALRQGRDDDAQALATWSASDEPTTEIAYTPARVLMQDFTGVPAIVDLAAMRDAMNELGADPSRINPLVPVELVIDHSIQVDVFAEATEEADPPTTTEMAPAAPQPSPPPPNPSTGGPGRTDPGPAPDPSRPDRPGNDLPPPPGSPAEEFERFCERYPKACD